ncbi:hypothetical protein [Flavobacterium microcysteis]
MKSKILPFAILLCVFANAQEKEELKQNVKAAVTERFPSTRFLDFQYQQYLPTDFDSELFDRAFEEGEIKNHYRFNANSNFIVFSKPRWTITTSLNYKYEAFELNDVENVAGDAIAPYDKKIDFHYLSATLSFTYFSSLFNKPFIYNASFTADGSEKDIERLKGFIGATIILKKTERTMIGVGALIFIDPASPVPVAPTFMMEHRFQNSPWIFDLILPQRLLFHRPIAENGKFSIGTELNGDGFYVYNNNVPGFADVYDYRILELRSGLTYEHHINKTIIATFKTGLSTVFNSRLSERGENTNDYIFSTKQNGTGYFNVGISFMPDFKKKKN